MEEKTIIVKQGGGFGTFLRGMLVGAAIAMLLTPRSGPETRDMLSEKGSDLMDKASDMKDRAKDVAMNTRDRAQSVISDARNKIQDTVKSTTQSAKQGQQGEIRELKRELEIEEEINNPNYPS